MVTKACHLNLTFPGSPTPSTYMYNVPLSLHSLCFYNLSVFEAHNQEALHYAIFSSLLFLLPSEAQKLTPAPDAFPLM